MRFKKSDKIDIGLVHDPRVEDWKKFKKWMPFIGYYDTSLDHQISLVFPPPPRMPLDADQVETDGNASKFGGFCTCPNGMIYPASSKT